jgi:hypothetical protein
VFPGNLRLEITSHRQGEDCIPKTIFEDVSRRPFAFPF